MLVFPPPVLALFFKEVIIIKDIFYRPNLEKSQSFHTDGTIDKKQSTSELKTLSVKKTVTALKRDIQEIKKTLILIPGEIKKPINSVLLSVEFLLTLIDTVKYDDIASSGDKDYTITEQEQDYKPVISVSISSLLSKSYLSKKIDTDQISKMERAKRNYYKSICSISNHYIDALKNSLTEYNVNVINNIGLTEEDLTVLEKNFNLSHDELVGETKRDIGHVADYLNKSSIIKSQKLRLCNKLFNDKLSITHVKSLELSKELLMRYCQKKKTNDYDYDTVLMSQIISEEAKLNKKLQEYYKYLNSSVILVDECLRLHAKEGVLKKKVNNEKENSK